MHTDEVTTSSRNDGNTVLPAAVLRNSQYHEFILGQIVRPYQSMLGFEKRIESMRYVPFGKNETTFNYFVLANYAWEEQYKKWFETVLERLSKIYKQCDYSFFPQDDLFANTLKRRMIEVGIIEVSPYGSR
jgi:hypothetical protein